MSGAWAEPGCSVLGHEPANRGLRKALGASARAQQLVSDGADVALTDDTLTMATSSPSVLSLRWALKTFVPMLAAAVAKSWPARVASIRHNLQKGAQL